MNFVLSEWTKVSGSEFKKKWCKSGKLCDEDIYFISDIVVRKMGSLILMIDISHFLVTWTKSRNLPYLSKGFFFHKVGMKI